MTEISLRKVSVEFPIFNASGRSLKKAIISATTGGLIGKSSGNKTIVPALNDISFDLKNGDRLALIGHNGSGKTTLLRVLAGIYIPTSGLISLTGKVTPMFDIGLGIDAEASGYENIITRGLYLGLSKKQIISKIESIIEFSDLGDFIDMPVHTYSSGMNIRLAFAVSTCFFPEILLLDEWISAGDENFKHKANKRITEIMEQAGIVIVASHSPDIVRKWCNKAIWLEHGRIKTQGETNLVLDQYLNNASS